MWQDITEKEKNEFNDIAIHPLQSYEWGEFRKKTGIKVVRRGFYDGKRLKEIFQLTIHKIPYTKFAIGYLPKGTTPSKELILELKKIGKENNCIFIQLEPNIVNDKGLRIGDKQEKNLSLIINHLSLIPSAHPLFTKYTFQLDLIRSEEELLKQMSQKTRYNIKVAQKHNVMIKEENSEKAFKEYLKLTKETTNRQGFFAHTPAYHRKMWETLKINDKRLRIKDKQINHSSLIINPFNSLSAHLFVAYYKNIALTTWILFIFKDTLYYPYGASSSEHRETMASNLMMWETIKYGKKLGLKTFDMWGSLGENPNPKDPWFGFHRFKQGYGPKLVEFVGSYDLIINPLLYQGYKIADKLRGIFLSLKR